MEDRHKREGRVLYQRRFDIAQTQKQTEQHDEAQGTVDCQTGHNRPRNDNLGVVDFFRKLWLCEEAGSRDDVSRTYVDWTIATNKREYDSHDSDAEGQTLSVPSA